MPRLLAAFLAVFLCLSPAQAGDLSGHVATVSMVCLEEKSALELADLDAQAGRTPEDISRVLYPLIMSHQCIRIQKRLMSPVAIILEYEDADGEASAVWRIRFPGAERDLFALVFDTRDEGQGL